MNKGQKISAALKRYWEDINASKPFEMLSKTAQRNRLLIEQGFKCAKCHRIFRWLGLPLPSQIHHIDGNDKNRTRENSELLCPNCHSITPNYMFKGRKHREETKKTMTRNATLTHIKGVSVNG